MRHHQSTLPGLYVALSGDFDLETGVMLRPFYFLHLILSGAHYRLVLIFRIYLVLPAFAAYRTSVLIRDYRDLDT